MNENKVFFDFSYIQINPFKYIQRYSHYVRKLFTKLKPNKLIKERLNTTNALKIETNIVIRSLVFHLNFIQKYL